MFKSVTLLVFMVVIVSISACASGPRPYDALANSENVIRATLAEMPADKNLLLTFGANWCSDSRKLAAAYQDQMLASLLTEQYEMLFIDVGRRDNNMQLAEKYQVPVMGGIPAVAVVNKSGKVIFSSLATDLKNAELMSQEEIYAYFEKLTNQN